MDNKLSRDFINKIRNYQQSLNSYRDEDKIEYLSSMIDWVQNNERAIGSESIAELFYEYIDVLHWSDADGDEIRCVERMSSNFEDND